MPSLKSGQQLFEPGEDCFFRNEVIHTEDSAVDDQNTITLKENKIMFLL